jgi:agmatine/peptidylarginine deiminase
VVPEFDEEYKDEIIDYVLDDTIPEKEVVNA